MTSIASATETSPSLGPEGSDRRLERRVGLVVVALTALVAVQGLRAIFSVTYKVGESIGFAVAGACVVALFVAPVLAIPLRRLLAPRSLLIGSVAVVAAGRLVAQFVTPTFALLAVVVASALLALTIVIAATRAHVAGGSVVVAVGVTVAVALDTILRATGITWDTIWRDDAGAWVTTIAVLAGLGVATTAAARIGIVPDRDDRHAGPSAFLLGPYLYLALFYTQSAAYVDSSGGVPVAVGLGVALAAAALAIAVIAVVGRTGLHRAAAAAIAVALVVLCWLLTGVTGPAAIAVALAAQAASAALLGHAAAAPRGPDSASIGRTAGAFTGGGLTLGIATLAYTIHPLQPLPVSNRFVPAIVGATMLVALAARQRVQAPAGDAPAHGSRDVWYLAGAVAAAAVLVPVVVAVTWPTADTVTLDGRALKVMTFNIDQGVANGPLDLEEVARAIEAGNPDVVVVEEVGRGWAVSGMTDEAEWLRRRLGMAYAWAPANDDQFGNVVLSRLPILDSEAVRLPKGQGKQTRSALVVRVDPGDGEPIDIIGTHLENGDAQIYHDARARSYEEILSRWGRSTRTVFLGDFNTYPRNVSVGWPELELVLNAGFRTTQDTLQCTMPTSNRNCPDWIFVSPDGELSPVMIVVDRPDHRPIAAEVTFPR